LAKDFFGEENECGISKNAAERPIENIAWWAMNAVR